MRVLIGTPIHEVKDYCIERWLKNVSKLTHKTPADLLMVDNSTGPAYIKKVRQYCKKHTLHPKIIHLELPHTQGRYERVARCREAIRQEVLSGGYDAWFSWETDQIIPTDALSKLIPLLEAKNFVKIVSHNNWTRQIPNLPNYDFGCTLIKRECLEKYSFILKFGSDPQMPATYEPSEAWFRKQVIRDGGCYLEVQGLINPIYHLNK